MKKIIIVVILIALFALSVFGCSSKEKAKIVEVPNIVNLKVDEAEKELSDIGLMLEVTNSEYSETVPLDHIISQSPANDEEVKEGTIVKALVSNGSKNITIPDLVGKNFEEAVSILKSIGLAIGDIEDKEDDSPVGTVLSQDPPAGSILPPRGSVKMTVSIGTFVIVPNVIGMNIEDAKQLLLSKGLNIEEVDETDIVKSIKGMVLYQYPMPGLKVKPGAEVRLKISK